MIFVLQGRVKRRTKRRPGRWLGGQVHADGSAWFALHVFFSLYAICDYCILHVASCRALQYSVLNEVSRICRTTSLAASYVMLHPVPLRGKDHHHISSYHIIKEIHTFMKHTTITIKNTHTLLTHLCSYKVAVPQDGHRFMMIPTYPSFLLGF